MANGHILYIKYENNKCIGILKVGSKKLFVRNRSGQILELNPMSVLDFYVHESVQRGGHGKDLFEKMLSTQNVSARKLAYDRPSPKLKAFLSKHYGLKNHVQ
jgi:alpha-tubulin N-acetyltransferase 1